MRLQTILIGGLAATIGWLLFSRITKKSTYYWPTSSGVHNVPTSGPTAFGASREGGIRHHAAIDLYVSPGDKIISITDGTVVSLPTGYLGLDAIAISDGSVTYIYAEIKNIGKKVGDTVKAGETIGYAIKSSTGSIMLHFEMWESHYAPKTFVRWLDKVPVGLIDPTNFLLSIS